MTKTFADVLTDSRAEPTVFYGIRHAAKHVHIFDAFTYWKDERVRRKAERAERAMVFYWFRRQPLDCVVLNGVVVAQHVANLQTELAIMRKHIGVMPLAVRP